MTTAKSKNLKPWPYYAPFEVVVHNSSEDCWLSFLGKVFDVTPLIQEHEDEDCIKPIVALAGKDVSHWFDETTGDIIHYIHPETGNRVPYCPLGRIPDVQVEVPSSDWRPIDRLPWWQDERYQIGLLTKSVRPLRIINMLIFKEIQINVCCEESFMMIRERYRKFCSHIECYTWRYLDRPIKMNYTLEENGIPDERECFSYLSLPQEYYIPCVSIFFDDDMKNYVDTDSDEDWTK